MRERALRRLGRRGVSAAHRTLDERRQSPGPRETVVVAHSFEDRHGLARNLEQAAGMPSGVTEEADILELQPGPELEAALTTTGAEACCLGENTLGASQVAGAAQRDAKLAHQLEPERIVLPEERDGAAEKVDGCRRIAAPPRFEACGTEANARGHGKAGGAAVGGIEVRAPSCRLLEMVSDELVRCRAHQVGESLVQLGAVGLGQGCVDDVPHEDVVKPETCGRGLDEPRLHCPLEERVDRPGQARPGRGSRRCPARTHVRRAPLAEAAAVPPDRACRSGSRAAPRARPVRTPGCRSPPT